MGVNIPPSGWLRTRPALSIRARLVLIVLAAAIPLALLSAWTALQLAERERDSRREALVFAARTILSGVEAEIEASLALGSALAAAPALVENDFVSFRKQAEAALERMPGGRIVVSDPAGQQLVNTGLPPGSPLPRRLSLDVPMRAFQTRQPQISDVFVGALARTPIASVEVPVFRDGQPHVIVSSILEPENFLGLLNRQDTPEGWLLGIIDRVGNFVARSHDHDQRVGTPAAAGWRAVMEKEGYFEFPSLEGDLISQANVISRLSGWRVGVAARKAVLDAPVTATLFQASIGGAAVTLLSLLLALWIASRIVRPVHELGDKAVSLVDGKEVSFESPLPELADVWKALSQAVAERELREQHIQFIMHELSHRSKNLLAVIQSIARQTARQSPDFSAFEARFNARVTALSDAHDLLLRHDWAGAPIKDVIFHQLAPFDGGRVVLDGPDVVLRPEAVQNISLAMHELATNAAKHGALATLHGKIGVQWSIDGSGPETRFRLTWIESGGPIAVAPPERTGFGRIVLERIAPQALSGTARLDFLPAGAMWTLDIPATWIVGRPEHRRERRVAASEPN